MVITDNGAVVGGGVYLAVARGVGIRDVLTMDSSQVNCNSSLQDGGGIRGGHIHGETDELGHHAVKDVVTHHDYHATLLQLFGICGEQVSFERPAGTGSLLDGAEGKVVAGILG